ncbi:MAG: glycosyltransferase family 1 protein [Acidobacteriaceae bacterium]|nr:glycosyltransferase family 1 protein [Acidobacteriaceae bacterium]
MARIVLNTFGSLGDLHPYLAIAIALRKRGHDAVIATSNVYRQKITAEGVGFAAVRPDIGLVMDDADFLARLWHPRKGSEFLFRRYLIPHIEASYEDLIAVCRDAELLVTHTAALAGPMVAQVLKIPWLSVALQPIVFFSALDPPVIPAVEWARHFYRLGPGIFRALKWIAQSQYRHWARPMQQLRRYVDLPVSENPMLDGYSSLGTLALFSQSFAAPQADWPPNTQVTGFIYYDQLGEFPNVQQDDGAELEEFLRRGSPPVLFTLGSSAVMHPGEFFRESITAVHALGARAILLAGKGRDEIRNPLPDSVLVAGYAPYSKIMPRVSAIVHQGGIGTTAQALRAGRPMLVTPWSHDQPDNAERVRRLGVGRTISRSRYYAPRVANELRALLSDGTYEQRAKDMAAEIAQEDGLVNACGAIESTLCLARTRTPV